jgi:hypothetical protein
VSAVEFPNSALIEALTYLMPGFMAAAIVYGLTPAPRATPFERIVQALIFTVLVQAVVSLIHLALVWIGQRVGIVGVWSGRATLAWSILAAVGLGLGFAANSNADVIQSVLRRLKLTHQTSFPSEWYGALCRHQGYVVLHTTGERRLLGWPEEWPNAPTEGHFVISKAEWLDVGNRPIPLTGVDRILIRASDVEMIEFLSIVREENHGRSKDSHSRTASTNSTDC